MDKLCAILIFLLMLLPSSCFAVREEVLEITKKVQTARNLIARMQIRTGNSPQSDEGEIYRTNLKRISEEDDHFEAVAIELASVASLQSLTGLLQRVAKTSWNRMRMLKEICSNNENNYNVSFLFLNQMMWYWEAIHNTCIDKLKVLPPIEDKKAEPKVEKEPSPSPTARPSSGVQVNNNGGGKYHSFRRLVRQSLRGSMDMESAGQEVTKERNSLLAKREESMTMQLPVKSPAPQVPQRKEFKSEEGPLSDNQSLPSLSPQLQNLRCSKILGGSNQRAWRAVSTGEGLGSPRPMPPPRKEFREQYQEGSLSARRAVE